MLPDVVQGGRKPAGPDIARTGVQPQEVVREEDGLGVGDLHAANHHFQVHAGPVLAGLAGGTEHLDVQQRILLLQADKRRGREFRAESIGGADPDQAGEGVFAVAEGAGQRTERRLDRLGGGNGLAAQLGKFPAVRAALQRPSAQLFVQRHDPAGNGGVRGAQRLRHGIEPAQPGHCQQDQQVIRTR